MTSPFEIPELVQLIGDTILWLGDSQNEPERLADLQAFASMTRLTRAVLSGHKDLVAARVTDDKCIVESHQHVSFNEAQACSEDVDGCDCLSNNSHCDCTCHAGCEHCCATDVNFMTTAQFHVTNDSISQEQCAYFQLYSYALYLRGNRRAAQFYLARAEVFKSFSSLICIGRVIRGRHLDLARELVEGKFLSLPYQRHLGVLTPVALVATYPNEQLGDALDFVMHFIRVWTGGSRWDVRMHVRDIEKALLNEFYQIYLSAERLDIYLSRFDGLFQTARSSIALTECIIEHAYSYTGYTDAKTWTRFRGLFKWAFDRHRGVCPEALSNCDWVEGVFEHATATLSPDAGSENAEKRRHALVYLMFIIRCLNELAPEKSVWSKLFSAFPFRRLNKKLMCPLDGGYGDAEQMQRSRKRLKTAVKDNVPFDEEAQREQEQCIEYQRALADYMEFVYAHTPV